MLERDREKLTIDRLRTELRAQYDLQKRGMSSKPRSSDSAFLSSESRRGNSKRSGTPKKDRKAKNSDTRRAQDGNLDKAISIETSSKSGGAKYSMYLETGHDPNICPKVVEEDANLALSESDQLDGICEYAQSEDILDAFFSVSTDRVWCRFGDNGGV